ncbi:hypothetical protein OG462_05285 [Streptomyces sp. NBC_01077]|uniref:hypothetical protein n=1 Tax=Streptomyces sp. NBC_01077 TaxID=2903746 RepID=UPI00386D687B|nr:hypothetical protein OG462_05285 [Streptomyces sp. NBC_01077]
MINVKACGADFAGTRVHRVRLPSRSGPGELLVLLAGTALRIRIEHIRTCPVR